MLWRKNARRSSRPKNCTFPRTGQTGSEYDIDIAKAAKTISHAFEVARWEDEKEETPVQAGFEITIYPPFEGEPKRIPENSVLVGSSRAFGVLGLNLPLSLDGKSGAPDHLGTVEAGPVAAGTREHSLDGQARKSTSAWQQTSRRRNRTTSRSRAARTAASIVRS